MPKTQPTNPNELSPRIVKQLASIGDRIFAYLLDTLVWLIPFLGVFVTVVIYKIFDIQFQFFYIFIILSFFPLLLIIIILNIILVFKRSQSVGKYLMNIIVFDLSTKKRMTFWKYALLRKIVAKEIIPAVPFIGFFYAVIDIIFIFREDRRTLHDHIADSVVLKLSKTKSRKKLFDFTVLD